jgi:hypothetical protein
MISKGEYQRRKSEQEEFRRRRNFTERWFSWWRNPPDRFAFLLVAFTAGLFAATVALWYATRDLVRGAEETAERQLRAYIVVTQGSVTVPKSNDAINIYIQIKNTGQTPAYEFSTWLDGGVFPNEVVPFPKESTPLSERKGESIVGPGQTVDIPSPGNPHLPADLYQASD